jgi:SEL1 protein
MMHLKGWGTPPDLDQAIVHLASASRSGHLLGAYNLAMLHLAQRAGEHGADACNTAVGLLKRVAERGLPSLQEANEDFEAGDHGWALLNYLHAAEAGSEPGQSNAAWMLTEGYGPSGAAAVCAARALALHRRSADQGNVAALLSVGDGYWYGRGAVRDWLRAAHVYEEAGKHRSAQALFNLGYMHAVGAGVPRDLHLAKRHYDRAAELQPSARLAVAAALVALRAQALLLALEPRLSSSWMRPLLRLFEARLPPPVEMAVPRERRGTLGRLAAVAQDTVLSAVEEVDEGLDAAVLLGLAAMLALVLWRRQTLRQRRARFFAGVEGVEGVAPAWAPPPAAAGAAAGGVEPAGPLVEAAAGG